MMKKGIRIFMAAALTAAAVNASAQFGVNAGYVNSKNHEKNVDYKGLNGFRAGVNYDIGLVAGLSLRPGVNYTFVTGGNNVIGDITLTQQNHLLTVPIDVKYAFDISGDFKVYAFGGPKFVVGLAAVTKPSGTVLGQDIDGKFSYDAYTNKMTSDLPESLQTLINTTLGYFLEPQSRFDVQLGLGAGVQFKSVQIEFGYDWGLLNRYSGDYADNHTMRRNQLYAGVGFVF